MRTNHLNSGTYTTGSKCILIVDDENDIHNLLKASLTPQGYTCIFASNAEEALEIIQQVQVDLVISDVVIPGMSGPQMIEKIATFWPHIPRILITAYPEHESVVDAISKGHIQAYIQKPWRLNEVLQIINTTIYGKDKLTAKTSDLQDISNQSKAAEERMYYSSDTFSSNELEIDDLIILANRQNQSTDALFNALTLCSQNAILMIGHDHKITYWNDGAQQLFGYSAEQALGDYLGLIFAQDQNYHALIDELTDSYLLNKKVVTDRRYELAGKHRTGTVFPIELAVSAFLYNDEWHIICSVQDITKHKLAESSLRASEDMFQNIVEHNHLGIVALDKHERCVFANKAAEEIIGKPVSELLGEQLGYPLDSYDSVEMEITHPNGDPRTVELNTSKTIWKGCFAHLLVLKDITERKEIERNAKQQEEKMQQIQKLESIGQLAAGIAHEINTPTQFIGDNVRFLYESFQGIEQILTAYDQLMTQLGNYRGADATMSEIKRLADEIDLEYLRNEIPKSVIQSLDGVKRIADIVMAMKNFSHPGKSEKEITDINAAIENTITVSRNEWKYEAELHKDFDPELPQIPCLSGEFNQAILNMIINATHAIKEAKKVDPARNGAIHIKTTKSGSWVEIAISDNGTGIPDEIRSKIFDPFFTTKDVGIGTGQGLAIAYNTIIEKHGGNIEVKSEIDQGTTFTIWLPLDDPKDKNSSLHSSLRTQHSQP
ncbi:MAG: PAS domain S-box protein [Gammaproteobacteria bacterium]